jgi:hypothetical protein
MPYRADHASEMRALWAKANPEKVLASQRKYKQANREKLRVASLRQYYANRDVYLARSKIWAANNPDKVRAGGRRHDAKPHRKLQRGDHKARLRRYQERNLETVRARRRAYQKKRRADPAQRIVDAIRRRMRHVIKGKSKGAFVLLGYTADQLRAHLMSQFQPGMTWDNYGLYGEKWHVDHKRPVSSFRLPDELVECFSLPNPQPLWARDNLAKHARI